ncbi:MAG: DNA polymerase III subunit delta [Ignavibacteriaceae bacterium]|nr:DNA polymerase III subunit delta [Ignavibacteriaceae bacterium]HRI47066.1 DNA polymerase III subunit delta [Ignavibacteriaceae bacterium]
MAYKSNSVSITDIPGLIKKNIFYPIYFLYGEDNYLLRNTADYLEKHFTSLIASDFDKEVFYGSKTSIAEIVDYAVSFPFSGEKKLIVVKEFEKIKDADELSNYIKSPSDFTILILVHNSSITKFDKEYLQLLEKAGLAFEAKPLKEGAVIQWVIDYVKSKKKMIPEPEARFLVELAGDSRDTLRMQIDKMLLYIENESSITIQTINDHVVASKEYTIFQLQDALVGNDKNLALKIAYRMLETAGLGAILYPLNKYFAGLAQVKELQEKGTRNEIAARIVGTHPFYYPKYIEASKGFNTKRIAEVFDALLQADSSIKTSSTDDKTILTVLITRIMKTT